METFFTLLAICVGNSPVTGEFLVQRPVTRSFDVFFDLRLNQRFSKQSRGWWFETLPRPLWHHCNVLSEYCACLVYSVMDTQMKQRPSIRSYSFMDTVDQIQAFICIWYNFIHWKKNAVNRYPETISVINSLTTSGTYMCQCFASALVQLMACHLIGAKPLLEPMLTFCQFDPHEHNSIRFASKHRKIQACENVVYKISATVCRGSWVNILNEIR